MADVASACIDGIGTHTVLCVYVGHICRAYMQGVCVALVADVSNHIVNKSSCSDQLACVCSVYPEGAVNTWMGAMLVFIVHILSVSTVKNMFTDALSIQARFVAGGEQVHRPGGGRASAWRAVHR